MLEPRSCHPRQEFLSASDFPCLAGIFVVSGTGESVVLSPVATDSSGRFERRRITSASVASEAKAIEMDDRIRANIGVRVDPALKPDRITLDIPAGRRVVVAEVVVESVRRRALVVPEAIFP